MTLCSLELLYFLPYLLPKHHHSLTVDTYVLQAAWLCHQIGVLSSVYGAVSGQKVCLEP